MIPVLAMAGVFLDLIVIVAIIAAMIGVAGMIQDYLAYNLVDILVDMPKFSDDALYTAYEQQRSVVVYAVIALGSIAWLITGRFGHRVSMTLQPEESKTAGGVPDIMTPKSEFIKRGGSYGVIEFGRGTKMGWLNGLPSRCILCLVVLFVLPYIWDAAVGGSEWAATKILNPVYSGIQEYPCPADWYTEGTLDTTHEELRAHHKTVQYLLMQDDTGRLDAMCRPELRVQYMIQQWGGDTKAIPPHIQYTGSFWDDMTSHWDNAADWAYRGFGEFVVNVLFGIIKAQAVIMTGTAMIISNVAVDVAVATMLIFVPLYMALMLVPWKSIGGRRVESVLHTYGPASLVAAILYPIEMAILFSISSELLTGLLLSEYGSDLLVVWLFGTAIMSMAIGVPIVTLGGFAQVIQQVTGKFTIMIQAAQGGLGAVGVMGAQRAAATNEKPKVSGKS